ncbi:hypothetical protein [Actinomadura bangladeshensis]|uniref:hypothetical protein n=1 Tax=Actinomadura bangladeshensis TaxID=453573 RepID=UPI0014046D94|nr:hypothetical protein [Actinomadura bangladeshensis]
MNDASFTDHLRSQAEEFHRALASGAAPDGTLVIRRDDLERWRDATFEEWAAGRLNP